MRISPVLVAVLALLPLSAPGALDPDQLLSEEIVSHRVPGFFRSSYEICAIPPRMPGAEYSARDLEEERSLCGYDIDENVAACPKTNSTNPGVDFHVPPSGMSLRDLTRTECTARGATKVAKYKLSISCSYTPSILAYYHVSRALGGLGNVPVAVLRTLDLKRHKGLARRAESILERRGHEERAIYQNWMMLAEDISSPERSGRRHSLFTADLEQSYGALSRNPLGEHGYREFDTQLEHKELDFKSNNPIYLALVNPGTVVARDFSAANAQKLQQLKDTADFILIDTILSQQDRFGNFHYEDWFVFLDGGKLLRERSLGAVPPAQRASAAKIKQMLLKDNDCGVNKSPRIKQAGLLESVAHIDPRTYAGLLALDREIESPQMRDFFLRGLQFREADLKKFTLSVHEAARLLKGRCRSGALRLDLDMEAHFLGHPLPLPVSACEA